MGGGILFFPTVFFFVPLCFFYCSTVFYCVTLFYCSSVFHCILFCATVFLCVILCSTAGDVGRTWPIIATVTRNRPVMWVWSRPQRMGKFWFWSLWSYKEMFCLIGERSAASVFSVDSGSGYLLWGHCQNMSTWRRTAPRTDFTCQSTVKIWRPHVVLKYNSVLSANMYFYFSDMWNAVFVLSDWRLSAASW